MEERVYNVPLRKEFLKAPKYKRAKKAVSALITFMEKHMKTTEVRIGQELNEEIWKRGIKHPPHHVKIHCILDDKGIARANLVGAPIETEKKEEKKGIAERLGLKKKEESENKTEEKTPKPKAEEPAEQKETEHEEKATKKEKTEEHKPAKAKKAKAKPKKAAGAKNA